MNNDEDELHELTLTAWEVNQRHPDMSVTEFLIEETCKKANRLGRERLKIKKVDYTKSSFGDFFIQFLCEKFY
jgi:hypothetical protein